MHALAGIGDPRGAPASLVRARPRGRGPRLAGRGRSSARSASAAACLAGWWYLDSESDAALTTMTVAWLVATAAYAGLWWSSRRAVTGGAHKA